MMYQGNIKLYKGDCLEKMKEIESESVDLCVIDPLYKLTSGGCTVTKIKGCLNPKDNIYTASGKIFKHNSIKSEEWFGEIYRVMKNGSHVYVMCNDKYIREYLCNAEKVGFKEVNVLVWNKGMHTPTQYYIEILKGYFRTSASFSSIEYVRKKCGIKVACKCLIGAMKIIWHYIRMMWQYRKVGKYNDKE